MTIGYGLRRARPDDLRAVTELLAAAYPALMAESYDAALLQAALPYIARANPALLASETYWLAISDGGQVIGCGGWTPAPPDAGEASPRTGHVRHFATHPDWTGHGIGRALYTRAAEQALRRGFRELHCYASLNAEPFYAALGFRRVRAMGVRLTDTISFPAVLMRRSLHPE